MTPLRRALTVVATSALLTVGVPAEAKPKPPGPVYVVSPVTPEICAKEGGVYSENKATKTRTCRIVRLGGDIVDQHTYILDNRATADPDALYYYVGFRMTAVEEREVLTFTQVKTKPVTLVETVERGPVIETERLCFRTPFDSFEDYLVDESVCEALGLL